MYSLIGITSGASQVGSLGPHIQLVHGQRADGKLLDAGFTDLCLQDS